MTKIKLFWFMMLYVFLSLHLYTCKGKRRMFAGINVLDLCLEHQLSLQLTHFCLTNTSERESDFVNSDLQMGKLRQGIIFFLGVSEQLQ